MPPMYINTGAYVDDETMVLFMARRALEEFGYLVMEAGECQAAIDLVVSSDEHVDLILCDIVMTGMSGHVLSVEVGSTVPAARFL